MNLADSHGGHTLWAMLRRVILGCVLFAVIRPGTAQQATQPSTSTNAAVIGGHRVQGRVTASPAEALADIVVYLECVEPSQPPPPPAAHAQISQKGAKFSPPLLLISVGQTVDFENDEDRAIEHNVFSTSPARQFDLGLYRPGAAKSITFDKPGPVRLYCSVHRYMDGVIYVAPTPYAAIIDANGAFTINAVPEGRYRLRTWQSRKRFPDAAVDLVVGATAPPDVAIQLTRK